MECKVTGERKYGHSPGESYSVSGRLDSRRKGAEHVPGEETQLCLQLIPAGRGVIGS